MAEAKTGRILRTDTIGPTARWLEIEPDVPLPFTGGQYIIVDTGLILPNGRAAKRAYSLLSTDETPSRFELAVKHIAGGLGSGYLHTITPGSVVRYSGPWGKFVFERDTVGPSIIIATDTGITAALGLLNSRRAQPHLTDCSLVWLRPHAEDFIPDEFVRAHLPAKLGQLHIEALPPVHDTQRIASMRNILAPHLAKHHPVRAFAAGDGEVNYTLLDDFNAQGIPTTKDQLESFFNMPKKSAPSP